MMIWRRVYSAVLCCREGRSTESTSGGDIVPGQCLNLLCELTEQLFIMYVFGNSADCVSVCH